MTVSLSKALALFGICVNSADPGYAKADFTNHTGHRTVEQAAEIIVRLATSGEKGPTAVIANKDGVLPW